jgi:hypothetical protein
MIVSKISNRSGRIFAPNLPTKIHKNQEFSSIRMFSFQNNLETSRILNKSLDIPGPTGKSLSRHRSFVLRFWVVIYTEFRKISEEWFARQRWVFNQPDQLFLKEKRKQTSNETWDNLSSLEFWIAPPLWCWTIHSFYPDRCEQRLFAKNCLFVPSQTIIYQIEKEYYNFVVLKARESVIAQSSISFDCQSFAVTTRVTDSCHSPILTL